MEAVCDTADLQLHHAQAAGSVSGAARWGVRRRRRGHNILLRSPSKPLYIDPCAAKPSARRARRRPGASADRLAEPGFSGCEGKKTGRVGTMIVAAVVRLGVVRLSGMRWRATTLMPLDPHDHGATSELRVRSVASGTALERALRVEKPSAGHPQCEAVTECG